MELLNKNIKGKNLLALCVLLATLFVSSMVFVGYFDLQISDAIYDNNSAFGKIFHYVGQQPAQIVWAMFAAFAAFYVKNTAAKLVPYAFSFGISIGLSHSLLDFLTVNAAYHALFAIVLGFCLAVLFVFVCSKLKPSTRNKIIYLLFFSTVYLCVTTAVVMTVKILWGRVRYYDLQDNFTHWYIINGINGNQSFPSGHVSSACAVLLVFAACNIFKFQKPVAVTLKITAVLWIACTMVSRIVYGAHYASDVVFSLFLSIFAYLVIAKLTSLLANFAWLILKVLNLTRLVNRQN